MLNMMMVFVLERFNAASPLYFKGRSLPIFLNSFVQSASVTDNPGLVSSFEPSRVTCVRE